MGRFIGMDHDQRFKTLIREFFADFLRLFFADWAARLDLDRVEWLDKELLPNPPEGSRHQLDLVARVRTREKVSDQHADDPEQWLALIHIEIESPEGTTSLKSRLPRYYIHLRDCYSLPVLPIVIYLKVGLDGIGVDHVEERFWELRALAFDYLYVGLPGLNAIEYIQSDNWLGVALTALMRISPDQTAWMGAEALRRLVEAPLTEQQRFLLGDCVQAYLQMDEQQRQEYDRLLAEKSYSKVLTMNKTVFESGLEKGMEKGMQKVLLRLGTKQFGKPSREIEERINGTDDIGKLEELADRITDVHSWEQLFEGF